MSLLRHLGQLLSRTPLHPQWLMDRRRLRAPGIATLRGRLLDIGSGDRWLQASLPAHLHYVALDYPTTGRHLYGASPDVFADAASLPFADASFDAVTCLEVLEHVPDPSAVLAEIARVLKTGGRAWLSLPFLYPVHDAPYDFQRYTEHGLRLAVTRTGLELVSLSRSSHALAAAGLLGCLALAGGLQSRASVVAALLLPLALPTILLINISCWLLSKVWPDWPAMTSGYRLEVLKQ